jgi:hypothetical protein
MRAITLSLAMMLGMVNLDTLKWRNLVCHPFMPQQHVPIFRWLKFSPTLKAAD